MIPALYAILGAIAVWCIMIGLLFVTDETPW